MISCYRLVDSSFQSPVDVTVKWVTLLGWLEQSWFFGWPSIHVWRQRQSARDTHPKRSGSPTILHGSIKQSKVLAFQYKFGDTPVKQLYSNVVIASRNESVLSSGVRPTRRQTLQFDAAHQRWWKVNHIPNNYQHFSHSDDISKEPLW